MDVLFVRVTTTDRRVVLHERHPAHPGGEVWLAGDGKSYLVGDTTAVRERIADGRLVLVAPIPAELTALPELPVEEPDANSAALRNLDAAAAEIAETAVRLDAALDQPAPAAPKPAPKKRSR